jgi:hypothetical protein
MDNINHIRGYNLLEKFGWYNVITNPDGVVKDHRVSIKYGFENAISSSIIGHIKNCEFLQYSCNATKSSHSSITLNDLLNEIKLDKQKM